MTEYNITPVNDLVQHAPGEECICGPDTQVIESNGNYGVLIKHHALDKRS